MKSIKPVHILLGLCVLFLAVFIYLNTEIYEETTSAPFSPEVRSESYLALKMLMEKRGVEATIERDYGRLFGPSNNGIQPSTDDIIILSRSDVRITTAQTEKILKWVEAGGNLVVAVIHSGNVDDNKANALLNELGVSVRSVVEQEDYGEFINIATTLTTVNDTEIEANLDASYSLQLEDEAGFYYRAGVTNQPNTNEENSDEIDVITFAQMEKGDGLISLLTEVFIWNNYQISDNNNAQLLTTLTDSAKHLYVFDPQEQKKWYALLYDFAPWFVVLGILLVGMTMWHYSVRFGSVVYVLNKDSIRFSQHIKASGNYYWRNKQQDQLLADLRHVILVQSQHKWGLVNHSQPSEILAHLSELTAWSEQTLHLILYGKDLHNEAQFTNVVKGLQQLRKML